MNLDIIRQEAGHMMRTKHLVQTLTEDLHKTAVKQSMRKSMILRRVGVNVAYLP